MSEFVGMQELLDNGEWRPIDQDPALQPGVVKAMKELQQDAAQARVRARLQAVDGEAEEDSARRDHLRTRLQAADDDFTKAMLAAAREDNE
jgi:hypothetical protein